MTEFIRLPRLKIVMPTSDTKLLFITGGRPPTLEWLLDCSNIADRIWCIDHGIDTCKQAGLIPELLIGDLDSARSDSIAWARAQGVEIVQYPADKDFTDTQLALKRASELDELPFVIVTGVFGGRIDHMYATLLSFAQSKLQTCLADQRETILFLRSGESVQLLFDVKPWAVSLLPFSSVCDGVSIDGVHWKLDHAELNRSLPTAISNRIESNTVNISIERGNLAVAITFET